MTEKGAPPVMILGCGRSGTSIFGELFASLAGYQYKSEPAFSEVMGASYVTPCAFKVPRESEGYLPDPGLSFPLATVRRRAPGMKFFWIVRHPLDVICSLRVGISKDWGHHPKPPDWMSWLGRPLVERCAHHWAHVNSVGFGSVAGIASVVTFEDMIASPEEFVKTVGGALKLERPELQEGAQRWIRRVQNTNNEHFVEAMTSRPYSRNDHSVRVGRWRENLSA
ncbi:MAG: sulfotransferase, partial [Hyphomicrobiales bacterium]|nr:sulfotransferase [Hyphomicrobiales bacterium]